MGIGDIYFNIIFINIKNNLNYNNDYFNIIINRIILKDVSIQKNKHK